MKLCRKAFLLLVGFITTSFDEISVTVEEVTQSINEQREKINKR